MSSHVIDLIDSDSENDDDDVKKRSINRIPSDAVTLKPISLDSDSESSPRPPIRDYKLPAKVTVAPSASRESNAARISKLKKPPPPAPTITQFLAKLPASAAEPAPLINVDSSDDEADRQLFQQRWNSLNSQTLERKQAARPKENRDPNHCAHRLLGSKDAPITLDSEDESADKNDSPRTVPRPRQSVFKSSRFSQLSGLSPPGRVSLQVRRAEAAGKAGANLSYKASRRPSKPLGTGRKDHASRLGLLIKSRRDKKDPESQLPSPSSLPSSGVSKMSDDSEDGSLKFCSSVSEQSVSSFQSARKSDDESYNTAMANSEENDDDAAECGAISNDSPERKPEEPPGAALTHLPPDIKVEIETKLYRDANYSHPPSASRAFAAAQLKSPIDQPIEGKPLEDHNAENHQSIVGAREKLPDSSSTGVSKKEGITCPSEAEYRKPKPVTRKRRQSSVTEQTFALPENERNPRFSEMTKSSKHAVNHIDDGAQHQQDILIVPHLSSTTIDAKGLPLYRFTVYRNFDESILYEFEVRVKPSRVAKNSGYGAFLIYLGARVLNKEVEEAHVKKLEERYLVNPRTLEELECRCPGKPLVSLSLTGNHLHGPNNSILRAPTEKKLKAKHVGSNKRVSVRLTGENLHYDSDEERMDLTCCPQRIGRLGLLIESDYRGDKSIDFAAGVDAVAVLDLGRYGPSRIEDRKRKVDYDTKNFLFDNEPSGWCFGVEEALLGCEQYIDITDDATGELHDDARHKTAIYVNEIGHNPKLVRNVDICRFGSNIVKYYAVINHPMKTGQEVELLVDYKRVYESIRERKGYGEANIGGQIKSDSDFATKLERNFVERQSMEHMIDSLEPLELYYNLEFLVTRVVPPVTAATEVCFAHSSGKGNLQLPTPRQVIARRRLHWLAPLYMKRIMEVEGFGLGYVDDDGERMPASTENPYGMSTVSEMRLLCKEWAHELYWNPLRSGTSLPAVMNDNLSTVFDEETTEEVLFLVQGAVERPMDVNMWCPIARSLTSSLCKVVFDQLRSRPEICREKLAKEFIILASKSSRSIRASVEARLYNDLVFLSGSEGVLTVAGTSKNMVSLAAGSTLTNSTIIKGSISALLDMQAYNDLVQLGLEPFVDCSEIKRSCDEAVVIGTDPHNSQSAYEGIPRRADFFHKQPSQVNVNWYLLWQNVYLVNQLYTSLVQKFAKPVAQEEDKFLEELCRAVNVNINEARAATKFRIRCDLASPQTSFQSPLVSTRSSQTRRRSKKKVKATKAVPFKTATKSTKIQTKSNKAVFSKSKFVFENFIWKPLAELGWTVEYGNRPCDSYYLPPGVTRGNGFKTRVDFFDSVPQILNCLATKPCWKNNEKVKNALKLYSESLAFLKTNKVKGELKLQWLLEQLS